MNTHFSVSSFAGLLLAVHHYGIAVNRKDGRECLVVRAR